MSDGGTNKVVSIGARVPEDFKAKLEEVAKSKGVNVSDVIKEALEQYILSNESGDKEVNEELTAVNSDGQEAQDVNVSFDLEEIKKVVAEVVADTVRVTIEEAFGLAEAKAMENYLNEAEVIANFLEKVKEGDPEAQKMVKNVLGVEGLKTLYEKASWGEI